MEARVSALEAAVKNVGSSLDRIEAIVRKTELDVAELKGKVSQLPTAIQMISMVLAVLVISGVVSFFKH